jgi:DNA-binding NarL/FixJ family response regulator
VRIVVVDGHQVVRTGFDALLDTLPEFTVLGAASDGAEAVQISRELRPRIARGSSS